MKKKAPALPAKTLLTITFFAIPVFIMIGCLVWQIETIRQTENNIELTQKKIAKKEQEIKSLQSQLATLRTIQATYRSHLQAMQKEFDEAESSQRRIKAYSSYPPKDTTYPGVLTDLPMDIRTALGTVNAENLSVHIEEASRSGFVLGTVKAYGSLEQLYNLAIELLRLTYVDTIQSSMIQKVANKKFITLKFWIRTL